MNLRAPEFLAVLSFCLLPVTSLDAARPAKPNILFIMVDDLGKEWISCYGAEDIETPNIDAMAAGGMRFENTYSMPQCTPTRVTLLTGKYPWRTGWVNHWDVPRWGSKTYEGKFGPNVYTDFLIDFMTQNRDKPLSLYFPMALTHGPLTATPLEPDVSDRLDKHKAMVRYTDHLVGRLVGAIDKLGIRDRTIVIFTTDNGSGGSITGTRKGRPVKVGKAKKSEKA